MPTISVAYRVPVQVVVDLDTGEVTRVVVIDESVEADRDGYTEDADTYHPAAPADVDRAYALAADAMWPGWEFGW